MNIHVLTERKGSNPGGKVHLDLGQRKGDYYFKYCVGNKSGEERLLAEHQPIYEAATLAWTEHIGLHVPTFFVLVRNSPMTFSYRTPVPRLDAQKPYYLLSQLVELPCEVDEKRLSEILAKEKVYRDCLGITDVSGKRQNYTHIHNEAEDYALYIDLGCSFVHAVGGFIIRRKHSAPPAKRERKRMEKALQEHALETPRGELLRFSEVYELLFQTPIPLVDTQRGVLRKGTLESLLHPDEQECIREIVFTEIYETLKRHKKLHSPKIIF
ncbi:hypothetical protein EXS74_00160 [Candidatus Woesearchaeota archaeon]|nr:hypothetical protein [Candidatus Woesearchaeota archaeon]